MRIRSILAALAAPALIAGAVLASTAGPALAAPGNGNSVNVQVCKASPSPQYSGGACVSYPVSSGRSNAWAPGVCSYLASLVGGYGFFVDITDAQSGNYLGTVGPLNTQDQCVSVLGQAVKGINTFLIPHF